jgi:hypothetical protein
VKIVLQVGELFAQQPHVVIVDQGNGAHDGGVRRFPGLLYQFVANEVTEGLGAVGIASLGNLLVEFLQKLGIYRHSNPAEVAHSYSDYKRERARGPRVARFFGSCYFRNGLRCTFRMDFLPHPYGRRWM